MIRQLGFVGLRVQPKLWSITGHHINTSSNQAINENNLTSEYLQKFIESNPELKQYDLGTWNSKFNLFAKHGFNTEQYLSVISGHHTLLQTPLKKLENSLEIWRSCQFGEKNSKILIQRYPEILDYDKENILRHKVAFLKTIAGTYKNIWLLFMNCPNLIVEDEKEIEAKWDYLKNKMRLEVHEIVKSKALSYKLEKIRCRHLFIERLGLFKKRSLKADPSEPNKNPRLFQIIDTSDKRFATKVCHVALEEYEAFEELFNIELANPSKYEIDLDDYDDIDSGIQRM